MPSVVILHLSLAVVSLVSSNVREKIVELGVPLSAKQITLGSLVVAKVSA